MLIFLFNLSDFSDFYKKIYRVCKFIYTYFWFGKVPVDQLILKKFEVNITFSSALTIFVLNLTISRQKETLKSRKLIFIYICMFVHTYICPYDFSVKLGVKVKNQQLNTVRVVS